MTAAMLGSKLQVSGGQVCGNMTSGGTESILMAVKSTRDFMRATRGITAPEMYASDVCSCIDSFSFTSVEYSMKSEILRIKCIVLCPSSGW